MNRLLTLALGRQVKPSPCPPPRAAIHVGVPLRGAKPHSVAYLTSEYPKVSHTFIFREIKALRSQGVDVSACSIRRVPGKELIGAEEQEEARRTFCVLEVARRPASVIIAHVGTFRRSPKRWLSALRLAWTTRPPGLKSVLWQFFYFLEAGILADHLHGRGVTHLHNHLANSACSVAMLTSEMSGIPYSFTLHGPDIFFEPMRWRLDEKIARARFVACISHFCRSQAMLFSDQVHWTKLRIVHCGVVPSGYGQAPRQPFGGHILFVGRLSAVKGATLLLEAFASLRGAFPAARLTIVGDGPLRAELEAKAQALMFGDAISFTGYLSQDEVSDLLARADMLVLPSFAEGVPVVLMEAMASRIPVVASQVAGIPELVRDGVSGFVVPAGDMATLIDRLGRLLSDPGLCQRMGDAGRAIVEAEYDASREAARIGTLFADDGQALQPDAPLRPGLSL